MHGRPVHQRPRCGRSIQSLDTKLTSWVSVPMFDLKSANKSGLLFGLAIMVASALAFVWSKPMALGHGARTTYVVEWVSGGRGQFYAACTFVFGLGLVAISSYRPRE